VLLNFDERNAGWSGNRREFHQVHSRTGTRLWSIGVRGNIVHTEWGLLGGKMQEADEKFEGINIGKTNEKSGAVYALERAREMCRKKNWEGYREVFHSAGGTSGYLDPIVDAEIDFDNPPMSLSFYKPDNSMNAGIEKLARAGGAWYTRKRNGMAKILICDTSGHLHIYSRRMLRQHDDEQNTEYTWDDRFPHIIAAIEPHVPPRSILLGELVVEEGGPDVPTDEHRYARIGRERFDLAQSYIKSLTPKAVKDMEDSGLWPFFSCWDIAFWEGQDFVKHMPMAERVVFIDTLEERTGCKHFEALVRMQFATPEDAVEFAKANGWEGFVVIDPHEMGYGDKAYNFKGKPDRPRKFCAKLKPEFEDDFIAIWDPDKGFGEKSRKESRGSGIKSVGLYQHNKKGDLVFIANVSSGLTDELIEKNSHPRHWPQVWKVWYSGRRYITEGDDTNALDFPRIKTEDYLRTDKAPNECSNERL
jgi:hypothetical protein